MSGLQRSFQDQERKAVHDALKHLHTCQGIHVYPSDLQIILDRLCRSGFSATALIEGIRSLETVQLNRISLGVILSAAGDHAEKAKPKVETADGKRFETKQFTVCGHTYTVRVCEDKP